MSAPVERVIREALLTSAFAEYNAGDGLVCELYLDQAVRLMVDRLHSAGLLRDMP